ncbi:hypothetical protein GCM10027160_09110 [Streptomyces calidiresistens]
MSEVSEAAAESGSDGGDDHARGLRAGRLTAFVFSYGVSTFGDMAALCALAVHVFTDTGSGLALSGPPMTLWDYRQALTRIHHTERDPGPLQARMPTALPAFTGESADGLTGWKNVAKGACLRNHPRMLRIRGERTSGNLSGG